jgi:hypothetical protein
MSAVRLERKAKKRQEALRMPITQKDKSIPTDSEQSLYKDSTVKTSFFNYAVGQIHAPARRNSRDEATGN